LLAILFFYAAWQTRRAKSESSENLLNEILGPQEYSQD